MLICTEPCLVHSREPGYPLLVSLLLYLIDEAWDRDWHAETLFLDTQTEVGIAVRPKMYRAVLMDQDMVHRVVQPSKLAQAPRYSMVWKLAFLPREDGQACFSLLARMYKIVVGTDVLPYPLEKEVLLVFISQSHRTPSIASCPAFMLL